MKLPLTDILTTWLGTLYIGVLVGHEFSPISTVVSSRSRNTLAHLAPLVALVHLPPAQHYLATVLVRTHGKQDGFSNRQVAVFYMPESQ